MCKKVVVLFMDPQNPPAIRSALKGIGTQFLKADTKKLVEQLKTLGPTKVAMDGICPKVAQKIFKELPKETTLLYVGGTRQQLRSLPTGMTILDNWSFARKNLEPTAA